MFLMQCTNSVHWWDWRNKCCSVKTAKIHRKPLPWSHFFVKPKAFFSPENIRKLTVEQLSAADCVYSYYVALKDFFPFYYLISEYSNNSIANIFFVFFYQLTWLLLWSLHVRFWATICPQGYSYPSKQLPVQSLHYKH